MAINSCPYTTNHLLDVRVQCLDQYDCKYLYDEFIFCDKYVELDRIRYANWKRDKLVAEAIAKEM